MTAQKKKKQPRSSESSQSGARVVPHRAGKTPESSERPYALARVERLGDSERVPAGTVSLVGTVAAHALVAVMAATSLVDLRDFSGAVVAHVAERMRIAYDIDMEEPPPPPPPPEPEPEPPPPEPQPTPETPPPPTPAAQAPPEPTNEPPPPAAAEAGQVLAAEPDPNEPLDLTDNTFVTGSGTFRGGVTASKGTATTAVRNPGASPTGVVGGQGKPDAPPAPTVDRSRPPRVLGTALTSCPWPAEADQEQINYARVRLMIVVGTDGRARDVTILQDPGNGFGAAARRCALSRGQFEPGLDNAGRPVSKAMPPLVLTFKR